MEWPVICLPKKRELCQLLVKIDENTLKILTFVVRMVQYNVSCFALYYKVQQIIQIFPEDGI